MLRPRSVKNDGLNIMAWNIEGLEQCGTQDILLLSIHRPLDALLCYKTHIIQCEELNSFDHTS